MSAKKKERVRIVLANEKDFMTLTIANCCALRDRAGMSETHGRTGKGNAGELHSEKMFRNRRRKLSSLLLTSAKLIQILLEVWTSAVFYSCKGIAFCNQFRRGSLAELAISLFSSRKHCFRTNIWDYQV